MKVTPVSNLKEWLKGKHSSLTLECRKYMGSKHFMQFTMTRTQEYIEKMEGNQEIRLKKAVGGTWRKPCLPY